MVRRIARGLLALAALILIAGGALHAAAFAPSAVPAIAASGLKPFVGAEFKGLWLSDATTLAAMGLVFGFIAVRPDAARGVLLVLLALVPAATAALLYRFLGGFYPAHMLAAASVMAAAAGVMTMRAASPA